MTNEKKRKEKRNGTASEKRETEANAHGMASDKMPNYGKLLVWKTMH